jgi:hypothetical protein
LLTRTTVAPVILAPVVSVTTPRMDAAGHNMAKVLKRMAAMTGRQLRRNGRRKEQETDMMAPSFPSERKRVGAFRTGLLTCAFFSHLPKDEPKRLFFSGCVGSSARGETILAEILLWPIGRATKQGRSQLRGSGGVSPPSRASWRLP